MVAAGGRRWHLPTGLGGRSPPQTDRLWPAVRDHNPDLGPDRYELVIRIGRRQTAQGQVALWSLRRLGDGVHHPASRNRTEGKNVVMNALIETSSDRWTRMIRSTGVVGLVIRRAVYGAHREHTGRADVPGESRGSAGVLSQLNAGWCRPQWR